MLRLLVWLMLAFAMLACVYVALDPTIGVGPRGVASGADLELDFVGVAAEGRTVDDEPPSLLPLRETLPKKARVWMLTDDYAYCFDETSELILVPSGFVTDLASIPVIARVAYNPADYAEAAVVHDYLYAIGEADWRKKSDRIFRAILRETNHSTRRAEVLFRAVRMGGESGYGLKDDWVFWDRQERRFLKDQPKPVEGPVFDEC